MNGLFLLWSKFKTWRQTKAEHSKQPLTRENAYALSVLGKVGTYSNLLDNHKERLLSTIKDEARFGNNYLLWKRMAELTPDQREYLHQYLIELGYQVLYMDERVILITWLWEPNSFKK